MNENSNLSETIELIKQIKLGCTVWVPRLLPEEIEEHTKKRLPVKLRRIAARQYEIESSDDEIPTITISDSDDESEEPVDVLSAPENTVEKNAENVNPNPQHNNVVRCDRREIEQEIGSLPRDASDQWKAPVVNFIATISAENGTVNWSTEVRTSNDENGPVNESSVEPDPSPSSSRLNLTPISAAADETSNESIVEPDPSPSSSRLNLTPISAAADETSIVFETCSKTTTSEAPHIPENARPTPVQAIVDILNSKKETAVESRTDSVIRCGIEQVRTSNDENGGVNESSVEPDPSPSSSHLNLTPLSAAADETSKDDGEKIVFETCSKTTTSEAPHIPENARPTPVQAIVDILNSKKETAVESRTDSVIRCTDNAEPKLAKNNNAPTLASLKRLCQAGLSIERVPSSTMNYQHSTTNHPKSAAVGDAIGSVIEAMLSPKIRNYQSSNEQNNLSMPSLDPGSPITERTPSVENDIPSTSGSQSPPLSSHPKIRVISIENLGGIKDPGSGNNFLNKIDTTDKPFGDATDMVNQVLQDNTNNIATRIAAFFKQLLTRKQSYEMKEKREKRKAESETISAEDLKNSLGALQSEHHGSTDYLMRDILSLLNTCVPGPGMDIQPLISNICSKYCEIAPKNFSRLRIDESFSQMFFDLIESNVYAGSDFAKKIPKEVLLSCLRLNKSMYSTRKRTVPNEMVSTQSSTPLPQSSPEMPSKLPRLQNSSTIPSTFYAEPSQSRESGFSVQNMNSTRLPQPAQAQISNFNRLLAGNLHANSLNSERLHHNNRAAPNMTIPTIPCPEEGCFSSLAARNNSIDSLRQAQAHAYMNFNQRSHVTPVRSNVDMAGNQSNSYAMHQEILRYPLHRNPPSYSEHLMSNTPYRQNEGMIRSETVVRTSTVIRPPAPDYPSAHAYPSSVPSNIPVFPPRCSHSYIRSQPTNYSSNSSRQSPIHLSGSSRPPQFSSYPGPQYVSAPPRTVLHYPPNAASSYSSPSPESHHGMNLTFSNSVVRPNTNADALPIIYGEPIIQRSSQYMTPSRGNRMYNDSSQSRAFGISREISLPPFSSFVNHENLVSLPTADSTSSPSAGPSPNPTPNNEMPLSVPIVQSTSSPNIDPASLSVDQLFQMEGLGSIGQPYLKDSELEELLKSNDYQTNLSVDSQKKDVTKDKGEF